MSATAIPLSDVAPVFEGPSYQDILRADGDDVPAVLRLRANPPQATADVSFERYTSQAFFEAEFEKVWCRVWQFACREEHVPQPGDYFVYDIGNRSILIVRGDDGRLRAFYNSCMHRGTKLRPSGDFGTAPRLSCPFHGWTYGLDGKLVDVPCPWEFPNLDRDANGLHEVRVDTWNTLVFVCMDPETPPLEDYLEVLPDHFSRWDFSDWYVACHARKRLECNWKIVQEAFIEAYHTATVHPQTLPIAGDANQQHDIFGHHVSRDLVALGVTSPHCDQSVSQQEIVDAMLMGDRSSVETAKLEVPAGGSARAVIAAHLKKTIGAEYGMDLSEMSIAEMVDSIKYSLFPNLFLFPGVSLRILYQFRPDGMNKDRALFDILFLRPVRAGEPRPEPAEPYEVGPEESYTTVPGMDPGFGLLFDQDTSIMRWQHEGMYTSGKGAQSYSVYLESRLRHFNATIDHYLAQ